MVQHGRSFAALVVITLSLALVATACSSKDTGGGSNSGSGADSDTNAATTVNATVDDFSIALDQSSASSGEITFAITNDGPSVHEFVVLKTDLAADQLPVIGNEVTEDDPALANEGEAEDIAAAGTASVALQLEPGNYVVICNIVGHYGQGMRATFTIE